MTAVIAPSDAPDTLDPAPVRRPRKRWTRFILPVFTLGMIVYLAFPVFVMILYSFNVLPTAGESVRQNAQFTCCTVDWWRTMFDNGSLNQALITSIEIALIASTFATILGTFLGLVLGRYSFRGRGGTNFIIFLAIAVPEIVLGSSLLAMFVQVNTQKPAGVSVTLGFASILLSHIAFSIAFVAITVRARVQGLDMTLENAAQDLFANPRVAFFKVTFPLILPGIVAGFLLAFVLSLDDFVITNFVNGTTNTFPTWVYGAAKLGVPPQVNVWGTVLFLAGVFTAGFQVLRARRSERAIVRNERIEGVGLPGNAVISGRGR
jgi:spermidine/putrescine transport system permease protein